jgi:hypothetical protein
MDAPNELAYLRVCRGCDGAGIQNRNGTIFHARRFHKPCLKQLLF